MIFADVGSDTPGYFTTIKVPFWGGTNTDSYHLLLALHIIAIVAAFGPALTYSFIARAAKDGGSSVAAIASTVHKRVVFPSLIAAAIFGLLLSADSGKVKLYPLSKAWLSGSLGLVVLLGLLSWFFLAPALKRQGDALDKGEEGLAELRSARTSAAIGTGLFHLGFVVIVLLMCLKPGQ